MPNSFPSYVVEEADETLFWFEIIIEAEIKGSKETRVLLQESEEILKIVSKSRKTFKENKN
jgi:hypothetical protein